MYTRSLVIILICISTLFAPQLSFAMERAPEARNAEVIEEDHEIEKDIDKVPVKDENVGKELQEEETDEKLVDEDA